MTRHRPGPSPAPPPPPLSAPQVTVSLFFTEYSSVFQNELAKPNLPCSVPLSSLINCLALGTCLDLFVCASVSFCVNQAVNIKRGEAHRRFQRHGWIVERAESGVLGKFEVENPNAGGLMGGRSPVWRGRGRWRCWSLVARLQGGSGGRVSTLDTH